MSNVVKWPEATPTSTSVSSEGNNMVMSNSIGKLAPALLKAQQSMSNAVKDSKNPFFKSSYADLNAVREASHPALNTNGITVLQPIVQKGERNFVRTLLLHESGEYLASDTEVVCSRPNDAQAQGSAISYARRYGLQALVSLGAQDDDGEASMARSSKEEAPRKTSSFRAKKAEKVVEATSTETASEVKTEEAPKTQVGADEWEN